MATTIDPTRHDRCPGCTHANPPDSLFCNACGARLPPQPTSGTTAHGEPRPWFRKPLIPEDARLALGPYAVPGAPKPRSVAIPSFSGPPESKDVGTPIQRAAALPPLESERAPGVQYSAGQPAGARQDHSPSAQPPAPWAPHRYRGPKAIPVRALVAGAFIAGVAGAAILIGKGWHSLLQDQPASSAHQAPQQSSGADTVASRPIDGRTAPEGPVSVTATPDSSQTTAGDSATRSGAIDTPRRSVDDGRQDTVPGVAAGQSSPTSAEPAPATESTPPASAQSSAPQPVSALPAGTAARTGNAPGNAEQDRRAGSRPRAAGRPARPG